MAQAPVLRLGSQLDPLEGRAHFEQLIRCIDSGKVLPVGSCWEFQFFSSEEEGNPGCRHVVQIHAAQPTSDAFWHNGHVAKVTCDGQRVSRNYMRQVLSEA